MNELEKILAEFENTERLTVQPNEDKAELVINSFENWGTDDKHRCFALHGMFLRDLQKDQEKYADIFDILLWVHSYAKLIQADALGDEDEILTYTNDYYLNRAALLETLKNNVKLFEYMQRKRDRRGNIG